MPDWSEMLEELQKGKVTPDGIRRRYLNELHELTKRNVIIYYSGWLQKPELDGTLTQINHVDKTGFMNVLHGLDHSKGLDLILHTPGGIVGATEGIVNYLRAIYGSNIRAFVPDLAMSGGTVIACACESIFMGKHSSLGPIDPQMIIPHIAGAIPAHAVLEEFERAYKEVKKDQSKILVWQPILNKYPPAFLEQCRKSIEMTNEMVTKWLSMGMFAQEENASEKGEEVVKRLTDYKNLKSHSRPLPPERCKEIGLNIHFLEGTEGNEEDKALRDAVLSVHHACIHTLLSTSAYKIIENHTGKAYIALANPQRIPPEGVQEKPQAGNRPQNTQRRNTPKKTRRNK